MVTFTKEIINGNFYFLQCEPVWYKNSRKSFLLVEHRLNGAHSMLCVKSVQIRTEYGKYNVRYLNLIKVIEIDWKPETSRAFCVFIMRYRTKTKTWNWWNFLKNLIQGDRTWPVTFFAMKSIMKSFKFEKFAEINKKKKLP